MKRMFAGKQMAPHDSGAIKIALRDRPILDRAAVSQEEKHRV